MKNNRESHISQFKPVNKIILFLFLSIILIGCNYPSSKNTFQPDRSKNLTEYSTPYVSIQFNIVLPQPLLVGEKVNIVILDEVTGLPYNRQQYEMDIKEENTYTTTLSIPMFSVIKYRYEKVGDSVTPEINATGRNVRYRMYLVEEGGSVNDYLSSWDSDVSFSVNGRFEGVVIDQNTGAPIPDIIVSVGGQLSFTDANGLFAFNGLQAGTHNALFYAINGAYRSFQQGATIVDGKTTPAEVRLSPNEPVEVTFLVTPPNDAIGAPIYIAGNFAQFGNTFTDLTGSMSIESNRMPQLSLQNDGKLSKTVTLYSGTDFRFKFTLGDGYWNAELNPDNDVVTRQLIVPDQNVSLELQISTWRAPVFEPITFETFVHPEIGYPGDRYIQFKTEEWMEPIRFWPLGNGNYLYILYSPFEITTPISYRVCLTKSCGSEKTGQFVSSTGQVEPSDQPLTRTITIDQWLSNSSMTTNKGVDTAAFPYKSNAFKTIIELSPEMTPRWFSTFPIALEEIEKINSEILLISPQWIQNKHNGLLQPEIGATPFSFELLNYISEAQEQDLEIGLFPQIGPLNNKEQSFDWNQQNDAWLADWFNSYRQFILNYTKLADNSGLDYLVIGGKHLLHALPDNHPIYLQDQIEDDWRALISDIREQFDGNLLWATNAGTQIDPLPPFIDLFDEIYIIIDSPIAPDINATSDLIAYGFTQTIDNLIYEVYRSTLKPISIALAYPSVEGSAQGCHLINNDCSNDGLFIQTELTEYNLDVDQQTEIYNAILPVAASRDWITAISIRGFNLSMDPDDSSSSIFGKPAQGVIEYWFNGLNDN